MPLTSSGKIDLDRLPEVNMSNINQEREYIEPRTTTEQKLIEIVRKVLDIDDVGVMDDFFALGGHSLLITQLTSRINTHFEINLSIKTIFNVSNIADLSVLVDYLKDQAKHDKEQL
jgi:acyl carrier protein